MSIGERERGEKERVNKLKTNLCFALSTKKAASNNNDFNFICFTCHSCHWNKQMLLYTRNHFTSVVIPIVTQHTPDELDPSILLILSCVTSSQRHHKRNSLKSKWSYASSGSVTTKIMTRLKSSQAYVISIAFWHLMMTFGSCLMLQKMTWNTIFYFIAQKIKE